MKPSALAGVTTSVGADTVYLCAIDKDGNIASVIQSIYEGFGTAIVPRGTGFALHNRGGLFTLEPNHANTLAPRKRPLHTIIPAFMRKDAVKIGFGIMGGVQPGASPRPVRRQHRRLRDGYPAGPRGRALHERDVRRRRCRTSRRWYRSTFAAELAALGHEVTTIPPRTGVFGHGQAVMDNGHGVHFGASEPRHDGAAIPEAPSLDGV